MDKEIKKQVDDIIAGFSKKQRKQAEKTARKEGFATVEESIAFSLIKNQKKEQVSKINQQTLLNNFLNKTPYKGKRSDGKDYFNLGNALENRILPTKEVFEFFLKSISYFSPHDFKDETESEFIKKGKKIISSPNSFCLGYITTCMSYFKGSMNKLMGYPNAGEEFRANTSIWFRELSPLIKNNEMYWLLASYFYSNNPISINKKEFSSNHRNTLSYADKAKSIGLKTKRWDWNDNVFEINSNLIKYFLDADQFINRYECYEDKVIIYRSFAVRQKQTVRKGIKRLSDQGGVHMEGNGFSYSNCKSLAIIFARNLNSTILKKYLGDDFSKDKEDFISDLFGSYAGFDTLRDGWYKAIGAFEINKKDIIYEYYGHGEDEVVVDTKKAKLIDYKFLNVIHFITGQFLLGTSMVSFHKLEKIREQAIHNPLAVLQTILYGSDSLFDFFYFIISNVFTDKDIKSYILNYINNSKGAKSGYYDLFIDNNSIHKIHECILVCASYYFENKKLDIKFSEVLNKNSKNIKNNITFVKMENFVGQSKIALVHKDEKGRRTIVRTKPTHKSLNQPRTFDFIDFDNNLVGFA